MRVERLGQWIAEPGTADVEAVAERPQHVTDPPGRRFLLVQDDQHRRQAFPAQ